MANSPYQSFSENIDERLNRLKERLPTLKDRLIELKDEVKSEVVEPTTFKGAIS